jgi:glycosyltransferase involved in cell wall biosynthesis
LYISTSKQEGFQNTLIQSAKNKTPILSLNVNPNKFITKYNCGFYCKDDFELLNQKLKELLDNQELYNKMSNNAYKYAKDNHNIRMNSKKFLEIIK